VLAFGALRDTPCEDRRYLRQPAGRLIELGSPEAFKLLTQILPLGRGTVVERNSKIYVA
jgi:hypothetical protein